MTQGDCILRGVNIPDWAKFGLSALEALGVPFPRFSLEFTAVLGPAVPSDSSPPVASPSLVEPLPVLFRRPMFCCETGVPLRLPGAAADVFLNFFREDSFPLDSDKAGEPGLFKDFVFLGTSPCLNFPCGVDDPLPLDIFDRSLLSPFNSLLSESFFSSSCLSSSSSSLD